VEVPTQCPLRMSTGLEVECRQLDAAVDVWAKFKNYFDISRGMTATIYQSVYYY
jgi:hypothetical protein